MSDGDVYPNDMHPDLTDTQLEQLLAGKIDPSLIDHPVAAALVHGMETLRNTSPATPTPALSEFVGVVSSPPPIASPPAQILDLRPRPARKRKQKMISSLAAFVATTTGKVALGATVAAAAVGSAQVSGVVDVVPDLGTTTEVVAAGPADDTESPVTAINDGEKSDNTEPAEPTAPAISDVASEGSDDDDIDDVEEASTLNQTLEYRVEGVGTVTVVATDGVLTMTAEADAGWTLVADDDSDDDDDHAEARFSDGTRGVEVKAEIEHGVIRISVKENGEKVDTYFDENGNPIDKPADADHDDDDDESDHDDDDESDHDDDDDDVSDHDDDDDDESDHDDDDDESDHDDDDDDEKKSKDDDKSHDDD